MRFRFFLSVPWLVLVALALSLHNQTDWSVRWTPYWIGSLILGAWACTLINVVQWTYRKRGDLPTQFGPTCVLFSGAILLCLLIGLPVFFSSVWTYDDLSNFYLPVRGFYAQALKSGDDFTWCPHLLCGTDLHGEGQTGMFHPTHLLLYSALRPVIAFNLEIVASYVFTFFGTLFFFRCWRLPWLTTAFGAFTFTFCSFNVLHYEHLNAVVIISHVPWLLGCHRIAVTTTSSKARGFAYAAIALLTGSQLLLGYPHYVWQSLLMEAIFILTMMRELPFRRYLAIVVTIAAFKLIGATIGGVQLLPTWESLNLSTRSSPDEDFRLLYSQHPANYLQYVSPYAFVDRHFADGNDGPHNAHEMAVCYLGVLPILLVLILPFQRRIPARYRSVLLYAVVLACFGGVLALGRYSLIARAVLSAPMFDLFRCPCRYLLMVSFAICVLATFSLAQLLAPRPNGEASAKGGSLRVVAACCVGIGLIVAVLLAPLGINWWSTPSYFSSIKNRAFGPGLVAVAVFLLLLARNRSGWALFLLSLFHVVDLGAYGISFIEKTGEPATIEELVEPFRGAPVDDHWRIDGLPYNNLHLLLGHRSVGGYVGLFPSKTVDYDPYEDGLQWHPAFRLAGVRRIVRRDEIIVVRDPLPRARFVERVVQSDDIAEAVKWTDLRVTAFVSEPLSLEPTTELGSVEIVAMSHSEFVARTQSKSRQLLVWSESYHPGWSVTVDGVPQPMIRPYGDFMGCVVDAGEHEVRFARHSRSLFRGKFISCAGLTLVAVWLLFVLLRKPPRVDAAERK